MILTKIFEFRITFNHKAVYINIKNHSRAIITTNFPSQHRIVI